METASANSASMGVLPAPAVCRTDASAASRMPRFKTEPVSAVRASASTPTEIAFKSVATSAASPARDSQATTAYRAVKTRS